MNNDLSEYHQDFYAWSKHNASLLRQGKLSEIDVLNLAEELDDIGISQIRALESRLTILLAHLLKWQFQSERQTPSWKYTLVEQRKQVNKILKRSPSLKYNLNETLVDAYDSARRYAASETHLELDIFPQMCPYSLEQTLDDNFYPLVKIASVG
jgi:hypothetical protein